MNRSQLQSFRCAICSFMDAVLFEADFSYSEHSITTCKIMEASEVKIEHPYFTSNTLFNKTLYKLNFHRELLFQGSQVF